MRVRPWPNPSLSRHARGIGAKQAPPPGTALAAPRGTRVCIILPMDFREEWISSYIGGMLSKGWLGSDGHKAGGAPPLELAFFVLSPRADSTSSEFSELQTNNQGSRMIDNLQTINSNGNSASSVGKMGRGFHCPRYIRRGARLA